MNEKPKLTTSLQMTALRRLTSISCKSFSRSLTVLACCCCCVLNVSNPVLAPFSNPGVFGVATIIDPLLGVGTTTLPPPFPVFSLHSKQLRTAQVQTSRRHCLRIPPEDMFFSASRSAKLRLEAKMRTSAMTTSLWRKEIATSMGMPWVGSSTSSSFWKDNWDHKKVSQRGD